MIGGRTHDQIDARFKEMNSELDALFREASNLVTEKVIGPLRFKYATSAPKPLLDEYERAQSLCFVTKYDALPEVEEVDVVEHKGKFYPNNIDFFRHLLNEYRPIIQNESDSTHFNRINSLCKKFLANKDEAVGLCLTVTSSGGEDVTDQYKRVIDQRAKSIRFLLKHSEFDYLYNGILQHADHRHTKRYIHEYTSGELHYVFFKHATMCGFIKEQLASHHYLMKNISGVGMGPL